MKSCMKLCGFLFVAALFLISCGKLTEKLPENYGIYANTDKGLTALSGQKVHVKGNLLEAISGLKGASGAECASLSNFIVFEKDINPKHIRLSSLEFKESGSVQNLFGRDSVEVNLWTRARNIDFDVSPIEGKKDMYRITPKEKLNEGFYALHFGGLENMSMLEASLGNNVYDIVIGNKSRYLSKEEMKRNDDERLKAEAGKLLQAMNGFFNNKEYGKIKDIYRPDGRVMINEEWQEFAKGFATWLGEAGAIKESSILSTEVNGEEGIFSVQTIYEKKGAQTERLIVRKMGEGYFITSLE